MRALPWHCVACVTSKARQTGARNSGVMGRVLGVAVTQVILHGPEVGAPVRKSKERAAMETANAATMHATYRTTQASEQSSTQHIAQEPLI